MSVPSHDENYGVECGIEQEKQLIVDFILSCSVQEAHALDEHEDKSSLWFYQMGRTDALCALLHAIEEDRHRNE